VAEIEVLEDGVGESVELFVVNFTWSLGVDSLSGLLNPSPLFLGDGVVLGFSKLLKSNLDLIVGEGIVVVGVEVLVSSLGKLPVNLVEFCFFFSSVRRSKSFCNSASLELTVSVRSVSWRRCCATL